jgi:hypothetical protein
MIVNCDWCGKFFSSNDIGNGARRVFTPDNEFGNEDAEYICKNCNQEEAA